MKTWLLLCSIWLLAASAIPVHAIELEPDEVVIFDGESRLDFPGSPALDLSAPATIEFWVSTGWQDIPAFDPCILSSISQTGVNYAVHVSADRKSIGLYAGERFSTLPFDFSDGLMHHVALISFGPELTEVQVDGETIGILPMGFEENPGLSFHLGSLDGEQAPFTGALARLRLWNTALGEDTETTNLVAQTDFSRAGLTLSVYPTDAETILRELAASDLPDPDPDPEIAPATRRTLKPISGSATGEQP